jgi:SAM-dependent methyltransferase
MAHEVLEQVYQQHHRGPRAEGFVFCRPERYPLFRDWVGGPGRHVLDLGCRDGALTSAYLSGNTVVGVDVDRQALARASKLGVETVWADLDQPLPFADASFDVVVVAEVLEHLRLPERTVIEARRVLRPGGSLIGSVPNCYRLKTRLRFLVGLPPERDTTLLHMFRGQDLVAMLDGLEQAELRYIAGRLVPVHPRLFANDIVFRATKPSDGSLNRS